MKSRLVKTTLCAVLCLHSVIGYLLWSKLCGTDANKEFYVGVLANGFFSGAVLFFTAGFFIVKDQDDETLVRTKLNSLVIFWSLVFFGGVLAVSFLKAQ